MWKRGATETRRDSQGIKRSFGSRDVKRLAMSSLDEIQRQINNAKEELADSRKEKENVESETVQALHRQQMRRQLDVIREAIRANQCSIASSRAYRERIDSDSDGTFMPGKPRPTQDPVCSGRPAGEVTTYSKVVDRHECFVSLNNAKQASRLSDLRYQWRIEGMSWLVAALKKRAQSVAAAEQPFLVGDTSFECVPWLDETVQFPEAITLPFFLTCIASVGDLVGIDIHVTCFQSILLASQL